MVPTKVTNGVLQLSAILEIMRSCSDENTDVIVKKDQEPASQHLIWATLRHGQKAGYIWKSHKREVMAATPLWKSGEYRKEAEDDAVGTGRKTWLQDRCPGEAA